MVNVEKIPRASTTSCLLSPAPGRLNPAVHDDDEIIDKFQLNEQEYRFGQEVTGAEVRYCDIYIYD